MSGYLKLESVSPLAVHTPVLFQQWWPSSGKAFLLPLDAAAQSLEISDKFEHIKKYIYQEAQVRILLLSHVCHVRTIVKNTTLVTKSLKCP